MTRPLYVSIRDDIETQIRSGVLQPGDRLPVEHELMQAYTCARMTVNKALSALVADGLIERRKKAGTFVRRPQLDAPVLDIPDIEAEATARGDDYRFELLSRHIRREDGARVLRLSGLHHVGGRVLALEERLIHLDAVPAAEAADFTHGSPGHWLLQQAPWTRGETRIGAEPAGPVRARQAGWDRDTACLVVWRQTWLNDRRVTQVTQHFDGVAYRVTAALNTSGAGRTRPTT
jgi:GntR family histidine utilization transcriptional repressor